MHKVRRISGVRTLFVALTFGGAMMGGACRHDAKLGGLGAPCNIDSQCQGDMSCFVVNSEGRCSLECNSDADCTSELDEAVCAQLLDDEDNTVSRCVVGCDVAEDCVNGGTCSAEGWCLGSTMQAPGGGGAGGSAGAAGSGGAAGAAGAGGSVTDAGGGQGGAPDAGSSDAG